MPKYTKLLPPQEYDKLTLDEKATYILDMADLLKLRVEPLAPAEANSLHEQSPGPAESSSPDQQSSAPIDPNSPDQQLPAPPDPNLPDDKQTP